MQTSRSVWHAQESDIIIITYFKTVRVVNKQSNTYTIIFASVLVIVVGLVLSLVYQALRPAQIENIANDTRKQILAAALIYPSAGEDLATVYNDHVKDSYIVNSKGEKVDTKEDAFSVNVATEVKKPADERLLPVFECLTDNGMKYILPVYGAGLWGPIWGYVSIDSNGTEVYGAYFGHQGETPGLGAEIEKPSFSNQFEGKHVINSEGQFFPIAVVKTGKEPADGNYVHAISGGTITSSGVQAMLTSSLEPYTAFLDKLHSQNQTTDNK